MDLDYIQIESLDNRNYLNLAKTEKEFIQLSVNKMVQNCVGNETNTAYNSNIKYSIFM